MRFRIPVYLTPLILLVTAVTAPDIAQAQNGCARCVAPAARAKNYGRIFDVATQYPADSQDESNSSDLSTFQPTEPTREPQIDPPRFISNRRPAPPLIPTDSAVDSTNDAKPDNTTPVHNSADSRKPTLAEKISQRYADPRVIRMLRQLNPQTAETFYAEISELIDERHIGPASYTRRVDLGLDHLIQALEVRSFVEAAQLQAAPSEITTLQDNLRRMRNQNRCRNVTDAVVTLRSVQRTAAKTVSINPSAISLEFLYGATDSLDQFSMLLPPEKVGGPSVGLKDNVVGIGVEVEPHANGLRIVKLIPGGPAAAADLRRGDVITRVDGNDLKELDLNRAVDFIVGPVGTTVSLEATRDGRSGQVTLMRQRIVFHSVSEARMEDASKGIAYIKLEQFAESTIGEIDAALMNLHQQGMQSLILDLRGNPGGLLTTAISLSDRFLPGGTIVSTRGRTAEDNTVELAHHTNTWKVPLVVLIDHNSASASEIFAAAIQENHRGLIIGEKSYGKGTVQTLFPLQTVSAALRLTTARFYSPDGREMAGAGVVPDVKITAEGEPSRQKDPVLKEALRRANEARVKEMARNPRRFGEANDEPKVAA
jgi:carboxyl-terminal processing protease